MNVLIVYAHPEPRSLNGALRDFSVAHLEAAGHTVQVTDLYAMNWKAAFDADDLTGREPDARFDPSNDSKHAFATGTQREDIARAGQVAVGRCGDPAVPAVVVLDAGDHEGLVRARVCVRLRLRRGRAFRYALGRSLWRRFACRQARAMVIVTAGGWESHYSPRGINGPIDDVLFPIQHGMLYYPGFDVLPPFVIYRTEDERRALRRNARGARQASG